MRALLTGMIVLAILLPWQWAAAEQGDIVFTRKSNEGSEYPPATFPHAVHRYQYKCYACHESIFKMKAGANPVTMQEIQDGKYCGVCHNGTTAFGMTFESCLRCHH